jgi:hypothetical protein
MVLKRPPELVPELFKKVEPTLTLRLKVSRSQEPSEQTSCKYLRLYRTCSPDPRGSLSICTENALANQYVKIHKDLKRLHQINADSRSVMIHRGGGILKLLRIWESWRSPTNSLILSLHFRRLWRPGRSS